MFAHFFGNSDEDSDIGSDAGGVAPPPAPVAPPAQRATKQEFMTVQIMNDRYETNTQKWALADDARLKI